MSFSCMFSYTPAPLSNLTNSIAQILRRSLRLHCLPQRLSQPRICTSHHRKGVPSRRYVLRLLDSVGHWDSSRCPSLPLWLSLLHARQASPSLRLKRIETYRTYSIRTLKSPRKRAEEAIPISFGYDYWVPNHLLVLSVSAIFAILNPLVLPFNFVYFAFALVVFKNQVRNPLLPFVDSLILTRSRAVCSCILETCVREQRSTRFPSLFPLLSRRPHRRSSRRASFLRSSFGVQTGWSLYSSDSHICVLQGTY